MFCCGHLRQAKPSLSDAGIQQFALHPTPRSLSPSLFPTSFNPLLDFALRSPPSLWRSAAQHSAVGVPPTPPTALAQISSLRHGLLTPSVGFRQSPARPSQGKVAAINHLPQSLSVSLGGGGIGRCAAVTRVEMSSVQGAELPSGYALSFQHGEYAGHQLLSVGDLM